MRIDERLNIVIPLYEGESVSGYVHSIPIARAAFEAHWRLISLTFSGIFSSGLGELGGQSVAALLLKELAARWEIDAKPLIDEIYRLSCFIRPMASGWETMPLPDAIKLKLISPDDQAEVLNALVFFTVASAMWRTRRTAVLLPGAVRLWGAETSLLMPSEWIASLQTSTETEASGETVSLHTPGVHVEVQAHPNHLRIST